MADLKSCKLCDQWPTLKGRDLHTIHWRPFGPADCIECDERVGSRIYPTFCPRCEVERNADKGDTVEVKARFGGTIKFCTNCGHVCYTGEELVNMATARIMDALPEMILGGAVAAMKRSSPPEDLFKIPNGSLNLFLGVLIAGSIFIIFWIGCVLTLVEFAL